MKHIQHTEKVKQGKHVDKIRLGNVGYFTA